METKQMLIELAGAAGVSGEETGAAAIAARMLEHTGNVEIDPFSNVICTVKEPEEGKREILLQAHLDEIGMIVTYIDDGGFLKVSQCGGIDRRTLASAQVSVYASKTGEVIKGVVCSVPPHLQKGDKKEVPALEDMAVDIGFSKEEAESRVSLGDRIIPDIAPAELLNGYITGKSLDNRAGCAAVIRAAEMIKEAMDKGNAPKAGVTVLLSTMEEVNSRGAKVAAYRINPAEAIVVDVSFAQSHDLPESKTAKLGAGPMIGLAPVLSRRMGEKLKALAAEEKIPYQLEVMGGATGTDADGIAVTRGGVSSALLSVPQRYMHTPVEMVSTEDIENTARLMACYVTALEGTDHE